MLNSSRSSLFILPLKGRTSPFFKSFVMKKSFLLLTIMLVFISCKEEKQDQLLPPELRQKFNCQINGEYWTMKPAGNCDKLYTLYAKDTGTVGNNPPAYLLVSGQDCETSNRMGLIMDRVYTAGVYKFPEDDYNSYFFNRSARDLDTMGIFPSEHYRYYAIEGFVEITELTPHSYKEDINPDTGQPYYHKINGWIEGTFEMTLINDISLDSNNTLHNTLKITNGKFAAIL